MASRVFSELYHLGPGRVAVTGTFFFLAPEDPIIQSGTGFEVERTAPGTFRLSLNDTYPELVYFGSEPISPDFPQVLFLFNTTASPTTNSNMSVDINTYQFSGGSFSIVDTPVVVSFLYILKNTGISQ